MKPEATNTHAHVWVLIKLGMGINADKPHTVLTHNEVYYSLEEAQRAQTWEAMKHGHKYEIFHLEFPLCV